MDAPPKWSVGKNGAMSEHSRCFARSQSSTPKQQCSSRGFCQFDDTRSRFDISRNQLHEKRFLLPDQVDILIGPTFDGRCGFDVKVEQQTRQSQAHLEVCQAVVTYQ